jgi:hypothetical protein
MKHLVRAGIVVVSVMIVSFSVGAGRSLSTRPNQTDTASTDRKVLWESFLKDCPPQYLPVEVYAENDSLTVICYRSKSKTLLYSLKDRAVSEAKPAKGVRAINRISYDAQKHSFILWHDGIEELTIVSSS